MSTGKWGQVCVPLMLSFLPMVGRGIEQCVLFVSKSRSASTLQVARKEHSTTANDAERITGAAGGPDWPEFHVTWPFVSLVDRQDLPTSSGDQNQTSNLPTVLATHVLERSAFFDSTCQETTFWKIYSLFPTIILTPEIAGFFSILPAQESRHPHRQTDVSRSCECFLPNLALLDYGPKGGWVGKLSRKEKGDPLHHKVWTLCVFLK